MRIRFLVVALALLVPVALPAAPAVGSMGSIDDFRVVSSSCSTARYDFYVEYDVTVDGGPFTHYVWAANSTGGAGGGGVPGAGTWTFGSGTSGPVFAPGKLVTVEIWVQDNPGLPGSGTVYDYEVFTFNCSGGTIVQNIPMCNGKPATIIGTVGDDTLWGMDNTALYLDPDDVIVSLGGNDTIHGRGGDDTVCAGSGNDLILGGSGDDVLSGAAGDDVINGGFGNDVLLGNAGMDDLRGGPGNDAITGGGGDDTLAGGIGDDDLFGSAGVDNAAGNAGFDICVAETIIGCEA